MSFHQCEYITLIWNSVGIHSLSNGLSDSIFDTLQTCSILSPSISILQLQISSIIRRLDSTVHTLSWCILLTSELAAGFRFLSNKLFVNRWSSPRILDSWCPRSEIDCYATRKQPCTQPSRGEITYYLKSKLLDNMIFLLDVNISRWCSAGESVRHHSCRETIDWRAGRPIQGKICSQNVQSQETQGVELQDLCVVWCGWSHPQSGNIHREDRALPRTTRHQGIWQHRVAFAVIDSSQCVAQHVTIGSQAWLSRRRGASKVLPVWEWYDRTVCLDASSPQIR